MVGMESEVQEGVHCHEPRGESQHLDGSVGVIYSACSPAWILL